MIRLLCLPTLVLTALLAGCEPSQKAAAANSDKTAPATNERIFQVKGVLKEIKPDGKTAEIRHEEIPNYMPAMSMPFEVKNPNELKGLNPGDALSFRMIVTEKDVWIDQLQKLAAPNPNELPSRGNIRVVRDVNLLTLGDPLPEYHFTNELGQAVSTSQYRGQSLAITFIFTRCPLPNFCPLMSNNFREAQKKLLSTPNAPTNWHLLTITFDPEFDTPEVLKSYSELRGADPSRWNFVTGDVVEITAISEQFGQMFWREQGAINHNLRTVVINPAGKVQKIFEGNKWTSAELVEELVKR